MAKAKKPKRLASDGAYGEHINGYSDLAAEGKQRFLKDARALLKEAGKWLAEAHGLVEMQVSVNPSGVAGSGDASATFWAGADPDRRVYVNISDSALGWGRQDALIVMARLETYQPTKAKPDFWRSSSAGMGPNQWLSANFDSVELADRLWQIYQPQTTPASMTAFTASGEQSIPSPIVSNAQEALAWSVGMAATYKAFTDDNVQAAVVDTAPIAIPLSLFWQLEEQEAVVIG
jgi:hypothetical protein